MGLPRVVILGGGFGGLKAARELRHAKVKLTLVDRTNHHLFQPLLYQVAASALAPRDIAYPIREILKRQKNATVIMDEAEEINADENAVLLASGNRLEYDILIVAVGSHHSYFGHPEWEQFAPGLKSLEDAVKIRSELLATYEQAEAADSRAESDQLLTFVVVGGGPTGVELAGAIAEIAQKTMVRNFRRIDPTQTRVYLVEATDRVLPAYPESLSKQAEEDLRKLGVNVVKNSPVTDIDETGITVGERKILSSHVIWAAGNEAPSLLKTLNVPMDRQSRILVEPDLTIPGHPNVFVIGDAACLNDESGNPLPGIAPVAIQQGEYVGRLIQKHIKPGKRPPFKYHDRGMMATIGKAKAVAVIGGRQYSGWLAWILWSLVHIAFLIGFRNRFIVMFEWIIWYMTETRGSRLIYEGIHLEEKKKPHDKSSGS